MREVRSSMVVVVRALDVAAPREVLAFLGGRPTGGMVGLGVLTGRCYCDTCGVTRRRGERRVDIIS